jgi:hypothetical protein
MYNYFINSYFGYLVYFFLIPFVLLRWFSFVSSIRVGQVLWFGLGVFYTGALFEYQVDYYFIFRTLAIVFITWLLRRMCKSDTATDKSQTASFFGFGVFMTLIIELILLIVK